ncbi:MAG: fatty acid kinase fatty acid binding subunit [Chloroflexota bacterium]|nr:fatty acid kinase fatty acid binding subunit [Chloroflexota bacterium]MEA2669033.1 fatty acid kinase fatty acid binding subunit [Chloroflexota bacterium]
MVRIVTDSTADLTPEQQRAAGITVVPLNVHFGDEVFRDHVDLSTDEFFRRLKASPQLPRTSQPSVGAFEEAYRSLRRGGDEVVSVHLSSKVSGTYNSALMAAQSVGEGKIDVVDSLSTSMALGFMALEGAKLAKAGRDRTAVAECLQSLVPKAHVICVVDTLTYLERGGRIGKARALLGSLLNVKPILQLKDGEVVPLGRARGRPQALSRLVELLERDGKVSQLAIMHGAAQADAEQLRERVAPSYPGVDIQLTEIGAVLGTHTGPGVIGFTYLVA